MNFADLGLSEHIIKAIEEFGITEPTTVQADVIPALLQGKDVFAIAPQGCGKTMSYVLPLLDIISSKKAKNILIITPNSDCSVMISDQLAIFNKYHEINEAERAEAQEEIDNEANVILGSPELILDIVETGKADISNTDILVVDDINLIKKNKQLENLEKILELLPTDKQNIVYTNRRSKETQDVLEKILKAPQEFKIDKTKEQEAQMSAKAQTPTQPRAQATEQKKAPTQARANVIDNEAAELSKKFNSFNGRTPTFILIKGVLAESEDK